MTMHALWMVTRFVTLMVLVGTAAALCAMWRDDVRAQAAAKRRRAEQVDRMLAEWRAIQDAAPWQQEVNETLADDIRQLKVYRRHHATRLAELEDLVDLLNQSCAAGPDERSEVGQRSNRPVHYYQTMQGRVHGRMLDDLPQMHITDAAGAAQPERSVGVRSDRPVGVRSSDLEHTQPLDVLDVLFMTTLPKPSTAGAAQPERSVGVRSNRPVGQRSNRPVGVRSDRRVQTL